MELPEPSTLPGAGQGRGPAAPMGGKKGARVLTAGLGAGGVGGGARRKLSEYRAWPA